jgi:hypothetical protein
MADDDSPDALQGKLLAALARFSHVLEVDADAPVPTFLLKSEGKALVGMIQRLIAERERRPGVEGPPP